MQENDYLKRLKKARAAQSNKPQKLRTSLAQTPKQAVLKLVNTKETQNLNAKGYRTKISLEYISRDESLKLENELGEMLSAKETYEDWKQDFNERKNAKHTSHIIFSINEKATAKNKKALTLSVQNTLQEKLAGYKYAFVMHTDTDNPHIHVMINHYHKFEYSSVQKPKKLNFNKELMHELRSEFANNLQKFGLNYIATRQKSFENKLSNKAAQIEWINTQITKLEINTKALDLANKIKDLKLKSKELNEQITNLKALPKSKQTQIKIDECFSQRAKIQETIKQNFKEQKTSAKKLIADYYRLEFLKTKLNKIDLGVFSGQKTHKQNTQIALEQKTKNFKLALKTLNIEPKLAQKNEKSL